MSQVEINLQQVNAKGLTINGNSPRHECAWIGDTRVLCYISREYSDYEKYQHLPIEGEVKMKFAQEGFLEEGRRWDTSTIKNIRWIEGVPFVRNTGMILFEMEGTPFSITLAEE